MPVLRQTAWYTVADCRAHPDRLYVFGDNLSGWGTGGQACIRHEPNAVGLVTKIEPDTAEGSYLRDVDCDSPRLIEAWGKSLKRLTSHLAVSGEVVIPADGLGTGRAELATRAPKVLALINELIADLEARYGTKTT